MYVRQMDDDDDDDDDRFRIVFYLKLYQLRKYLYKKNAAVQTKITGHLTTGLGLHLLDKKKFVKYNL